MSDISKNIKRIRTAKGMNQTELAEKVGVTRQTISSWEKGSSFPNINMLEKMSAVFDMPIDELLYPHQSTRKSKSTENPFSFAFIFLSVLVYSIVLLYSGSLYLGLILLVAFIAICVSGLYVCISEDLSDRNSNDANEE